MSDRMVVTDVAASSVGAGLYVLLLGALLAGGAAVVQLAQVPPRPRPSA